MKKTKKEIWLNELRWGQKGAANEWEERSKHFSKSAAMKAAKECQDSCGIPHRVRKKK